MKFFLIYFIILFHLSLAAEGDYGVFLPSTPTSKEYIPRTIKPQAIGLNSNIRTFIYIPNEIYEVTFYYDNIASIEFEADEAVSQISIPPTLQNAWQIQPTINKLIITPLASNADAIIYITTNKRDYQFKFIAKEPTSKSPEYHYSTKYQFHYPSQDDAQNIKTYTHSLMPDIDQNPGKYNFNYTVTGEDSLYPVKVFDNGEFTYFEFPKHSYLPAIFSVDSSNFEGVVNFRMEGPYMIVEDIGARFSLRNGADIVCVFNEQKTSKLPSNKKSKRRQKKDLDYNVGKEGYQQQERGRTTAI